MVPFVMPCSVTKTVFMHAYVLDLQVKGAERTKLKDGAPLEVFTSTPNKHYPLLSGEVAVL